jgi:DNA mismatch repair protein MutH
MRPRVRIIKLARIRETSAMKTFSELVRRYSEVQAVPFRELALILHCPLPADPKADKGYAGRLMEKVANKGPDSSSSPDLADFDVEVKTVPVRLDMGRSSRRRSLR